MRKSFIALPVVLDAKFDEKWAIQHAVAFFPFLAANFNADFLLIIILNAVRFTFDSPLWLVALLCKHAWWDALCRAMEKLVHAYILGSCLLHSHTLLYVIFGYFVSAKIDIASFSVGITGIVLHTTILSSHLVRSTQFHAQQNISVSFCWGEWRACSIFKSFTIVCLASYPLNKFNYAVDMSTIIEPILQAKLMAFNW